MALYSRSVLPVHKHAVAPQVPCAHCPGDALRASRGHAQRPAGLLRAAHLSLAPKPGPAPSRPSGRRQGKPLGSVCCEHSVSVPFSSVAGVAPTKSTLPFPYLSKLYPAQSQNVRPGILSSLSKLWVLRLPSTDRPSLRLSRPTTLFHRPVLRTWVKYGPWSLGP